MRLFDNLLRRTNNNDRILNILTFNTHESWQSFLALTGHNFFHIESQERKLWMVDYRPIPSNVTMINSQMVTQIPMDIILSQTLTGQFQYSEELSRKLCIPHVNVEHTMPYISHDQKAIDSLRDVRINSDCKKIIFISKHSQGKWGFDDTNSGVIYHGIDHNLFSGYNGDNKNVVSVANLYRERGDLLGWDIFAKTILSNKIPCLVIGDNKGISERAKNVYDLINKLKCSRVFFNTSLWSPIPISVLEAMSVGLPVITTDTCAMNYVIQNDYNGFISNDINFLIEKLKWSLDDKNFDKIKEMGKNARNTIIEKFNIIRFVKQWNSVFYKAVGIKPEII